MSLAYWWSNKRACWAISLISWSLRVLTPENQKRDIAEWAIEYSKMLILRLTPSKR